METECRYDIIYGRDFCSKYGIVLDFEDQMMQVLKTSVPMRPMPNPKQGEIAIAEMLARENDDAFLMQLYDDRKD